MKHLYQAALLGALGLGSITAAQAGSSDLYIGFNDAAGPTSANNDYVIDIGSFSAVTAAANANGGTVDLMSANAPIQFNQSTFSSTFGTAFSGDSSYLSDVAVGVAGGLNPGTPRTLWQTAPTSVTAPHTISGSQLRTAANQPESLAAGEYASSTTGNGWTWLVAASPVLPGTEPSGSVASSTGTNPMDFLTAGHVVLNLWQNTTASSVSTTTSGWVDEGYFTFNLSANGPDDITYTVLGAVPEPATYGMVTGGLLLALALGRRFLPGLKRGNQ